MVIIRSVWAVIKDRCRNGITSHSNRKIKTQIYDNISIDCYVFEQMLEKHLIGTPNWEILFESSDAETKVHNKIAISNNSAGGYLMQT